VKQYLVAAIVALVPVMASAQGSTGPFGGLFGRTPHRTGLDFTVFEVRGSSGILWNDLLSEPDPGQPVPPFAGVVGNTLGGVNYDRRSDRLELQAGTSVDFRNSFADDLRGTTVDGGMALKNRYTTRLSSEVALNYRRSPFYEYFPIAGWMSDGIVTPGIPYEVNTLGYQSAYGNAGVALQYSKSSTLSANVSRQEMWFADSPQNDTSESSYEALWTRRLTRDLGIRAGYGHREFRMSAATTPYWVEEEIDLGVDFQRGIALAPRTSLGIMTHTSVIRRRNQETLYRLNGELRLTKSFKRTWTAQLEARRATEVLAGFVDPLFSDSLSFSTSGLLSNRIQFVTMVTGKHGRFGYEGERGRPFTMVGASTNLNFALSRHVGLYTQYGIYHHDAPPDRFTVSTIADVSRQTFTVGLTAWLPVFTRERSPIGSR